MFPSDLCLTHVCMIKHVGTFTSSMKSKGTMEHHGIVTPRENIHPDKNICRKGKWIWLLVLWAHFALMGDFCWLLVSKNRTHQLHPSMTPSHWTLSQVMVTKLIHLSCKASTCVCKTLCICMCACERETHTQNFFELASAFNLWTSFKPKQAQKNIHYIVDLSAVIG